ncbi:Flavonol synthase/flavanone 3-hydroxylase [Morus notabilis]|uniref:Flavonol synthase/flavanone 3-hydroxylase n=1 Tax=Morus notabilis TaxID=981085 RepID=W9QR37_9ROSA|nr:flavonol synthase/flavanone 3-hydroxylase [Morus notabilis]EXB51041.1 Flavonol synthase/flavanone 3-hydroxylase [Morus notabilis]
MEVERVQVIASLSLNSNVIPAEFDMPESEKPDATTFRGPIPEIPVIDFSDPDEENLIRRIAEASKEWGFFQAVNHNIPAEVIRRLQEAGTEFFGFPQEEKEVYAKPGDAQSAEGYGTKHQKLENGKKPWSDHLFHRIWPPSRINYQFWPKIPSYYREVNEEYGTHVRGFADKVFRSLSLGLGLEANAMKEAFGGEELEYILKINYYPPCPRPDLTFGVLAHTDMSALTILVPNEVPGLQVLKDDHWIDAKYVPNAIIVHMGDQIEIASNGYYKSVLHRTTVNKEKARMSWPVFLEPPLEFVVGPISQLLNEQNPPKYKSKMFKDYAYCKLNKLPQ